MQSSLSVLKHLLMKASAEKYLNSSDEVSSNSSEKIRDVFAGNLGIALYKSHDDDKHENFQPEL